LQGCADVSRERIILMSWVRNNSLGIYIAVPFCRSKCTYCNFASGVYSAGEHGHYVDRLIEDLTGAGAWASRMGVALPQTVDTVYLGGGTPTLLAPELIQRLFGVIRAVFDVDRGAEITVECAPGQLPDATLDALAQVGVNRVSLGVQSFIDREARETGRLHNRAMVMEDLRRLRAAGIDNLNVDLIAGLPGQTFASWEGSLDVLIDSGVPHASIYMLEVDEDSRLGREMLSGGGRYHAGLVPTDDAIARMYETAVERLESAGLAQYEISNFGRASSASQHNLRYWKRRPYMGVGLDASSALCASAPSSDFVVRATTTDDLKAYLDSGEDAETTRLSPDQQHEEAWFLGLRLNAGVEIAELVEEFGLDSVRPALQVAARLEADGLVVSDGQKIQLTGRGRMLSNDVFQEFLGLDAVESASRVVTD
jgi:oxygen-independent coproporphyrinogen III oxidase